MAKHTMMTWVDLVFLFMGLIKNHDSNCANQKQKLFADSLKLAHFFGW